MTEHSTINQCPNCGHQADENFCPKCGQETHLHRETFGGMVLHFIAHYFHYDSKFRQTLKKLLFAPGALTIAYLKKQRMRYIPPISLYIFVSAVFFIAVLVNPDKILKAHKGEITFRNHPAPSDDSVKHLKVIQDKKLHGVTPWYQYDPNRDTANFMHSLVLHGEKIDEETNGNMGAYLLEHLYHALPKVFFFMIPLMALLLRLILYRKDIIFSETSVFSLHYHSFVFTLFILLYLPLINRIPYLWLILVIIACFYLVLALRKVYQIRLFKAVLYSLLIGLVYVVFLIIALITDFLLIVFLA